MKDILLKLPVNSVEDILSSVYSNNENSSLPELEEVINSLDLPSNILDDFLKPDSLTNVLYKKTEDGKFVFPKSQEDKKTWGFGLKLPNSVANHVGNIGDLTSAYHKENLKQHASVVVNNLDKMPIRSSKKDLLLLTGLFHDFGRKYLTQTGDKEKFPTDALYKYKDEVTGQLYAPDQEKLSAYISARYFKKMGISEEEARPYIASIYYQNRLKTGWEKDVVDKNGAIIPDEYDYFIKAYGDETYNLLRSLSSADKGLLTNKTLANAQSYIEQGQKIVLQKLDPFILNITSRKPMTVKEVDDKFYATSQFDEFEKDARETSSRILQQKQQEEQRRINQKTYEEIIENERILVEEQRKLENELINNLTNVGAVVGTIAGAKQLIQEFNREKLNEERRKKEMLHATEQDFIDLDGDGIDDRLEKDKGLDLSL